jgi:peptide/nickel transport system permease protein
MKIFHDPSGLVGTAIVLILLLMFVAGPLLAPYSESQQDIANRLQGPSAAHVFGTDHLGRDVFSRLVIGTRVALGVALPSVLIALAVGLVFGLLAGYLGGWVDAAVLLLANTLQSIPSILLALAILALIGPSTGSVIGVIALGLAMGYALVVRGQVLTMRNLAYVEVSRALGASTISTLLRHVLPNIVSPLIVLVAMDIPSAITTEAGLSFLGLGVRPPTPSWGVVLSDGFGRIRQSPWAVLFASLMLMVATMGFTLFGEYLRKRWAPKT